MSSKLVYTEKATMCLFDDRLSERAIPERMSCVLELSQVYALITFKLLYFHVMHVFRYR